MGAVAGPHDPSAKGVGGLHGVYGYRFSRPANRLSRMLADSASQPSELVPTANGERQEIRSPGSGFNSIT